MSTKNLVKTACLTVLFTLAMLTTVFGVEYFYDGAYHEYKGNTFKLEVNGKKLDTAIPPLIFNDYSVVPARAVFQDGLGAAVSWDGAKRQVTVTLGSKTLLMTIDDPSIKVNDTWYTMPIPPKIVNDYTMIPARFVAETLGMQVNFESKTDTISIQSEEPLEIKSVVYSNPSEEEALLEITTNAESPAYCEFYLKSPLRLVVDVYGFTFKEQPENITVNSDNLKSIRFGEQERASRIVFDLEKDYGYNAWVEGTKLLVKVNIKGNKTTTSSSPAPTPTASPTASSKPAEDAEIFKKITFSAEDGWDHVKLKNVTMGTPVHSGKEVTIPIKGEGLPGASAEKEVEGYFSSKMVYKPIDSKQGTVVLKLKKTDVEMLADEDVVHIKAKYKYYAKTVTLDVGHGGMDGGSVAYNDDKTIKVKEKDLNLSVALRAQKLLEAAGIKVHMIRTTDVLVDYQKVGGMANRAGSTLFVSVHTNAAGVSTANGIETYGYLGHGTVYNGMTGERLSEILLENLLEQTGALDRGVKDGEHLSVINSTTMPSTLIEIGFISNPEECDKMMQPEYQDKLAQAICDGVLQAFEEMGL